MCSWSQYITYSLDMNFIFQRTFLTLLFISILFRFAYSQTVPNPRKYNNWSSIATTYNLNENFVFNNTNLIQINEDNYETWFTLIRLGIKYKMNKKKFRRNLFLTLYISY
jgi:hypothetical protein